MIAVEESYPQKPANENQLQILLIGAGGNAELYVDDQEYLLLENVFNITGPK